MTPGHAPLQAINDFVVKFANVNGSGSASANELFAKAILRMGVPVSPRNIFPPTSRASRLRRPALRTRSAGPGCWTERCCAG